MNMPLFDEVHVCEGCERQYEGKLPVGWVECGISKADPKKLAAWCPRCQIGGVMDARTAASRQRGADR